MTATPPQVTGIVSQTTVVDPGGLTETVTTVYSMTSGPNLTTVSSQPAPGSPAAIASTIEADLLAGLATVEAWMAANPTGAILTAGQTYTLAKGLVGVIRILLNQTQTQGQA